MLVLMSHIRQQKETEMDTMDFADFVEVLAKTVFTSGELKRAMLDKAIDELSSMRDFAEDNNQWDEADVLTDRISVLLDRMSMIAKPA
jgi:cysteinyl-tRNA synthetase